MSKRGLDVRVGAFVLVGLTVLGALLLQFSKGTSMFRPTWTLVLHAANVGGLKVRSGAFMAGVPIGTVSQITLAPDCKSVDIKLSIYKDFKIYKDARFAIEQSGLLGDNYVAVLAQRNEGGTFKDGDEATVEEPFNLQEVARSAAGFVKRIDETASNLNTAIGDVRRLVLNEHTLTNFAATVDHLHDASGAALQTVRDIDYTFATNGVAIALALSNLVTFSQQLNRFSDSLNSVLQTNGTDIAVSVRNIETSTTEIKTMLDDVNAGKGPLGMVLRDQQVAADLADITHNFSITSSNLNRHGLWYMLWSHAPPRTNAPPSEDRHPSRIQPE